MIQSSTGDLYTGISKDPKQRLKTHTQGRGAQFTDKVVQFEIVFLEEYPTAAEARTREIQIKKWRRDKKEFLIRRYQAGMPTKMDRFV